MAENGQALWVKIALVFLPLAVAGLVGYGSLRSTVQSNQEILAGKASQQSVNEQFAAILRELDGINRRLDKWNPR